MASGRKLLTSAKYAIGEADYFVAAGLIQVYAALVKVLQEEASYVPVHLGLGVAVPGPHTFLEGGVDAHMGVQLLYQGTAHTNRTE